MNKAMLICLSNDEQGNKVIKYLRYMCDEDYRDTIELANSISKATNCDVHIVPFDPQNIELLAEIESHVNIKEIPT